MIQPGLFDMQNRLESLSQFGDPIEKLKEVVDFEVFRSDLEGGLDFSDRAKCDILLHTLHFRGQR